MDPKPRGPTTTSPSTLLTIEEVAELLISKVLAACATKSSTQKENSMPDSLSVPQYVNEIRAAEITGMSRVWFQRARAEGIGPKFFRIGTRICYRLDDLVRWVESGAAGREHVSSPRRKKGV
jgi:predicted DNA-binding transcriptional regulator AlpA